MLCSSFRFLCGLTRSHARLRRRDLEAGHVVSVELCVDGHTYHAVNAFRRILRHGEWQLKILFTALRLPSVYGARHPAPVANDPREFLHLWICPTVLRTPTQEEEMVPVQGAEGPPQRSGRLVQRLRQS